MQGRPSQAPCWTASTGPGATMVSFGGWSSLQSAYFPNPKVLSLQCVSPLDRRGHSDFSAQALKSRHLVASCSQPEKGCRAHTGLVGARVGRPLGSARLQQLCSFSSISCWRRPTWQAGAFSSKTLSRKTSSSRSTVGR